jgi:hypothetical protein
MEDLSMTRPLPRLLPLSLLLVTALGGCSAPVSLALLVQPPGGPAPARIEVRAYDGGGLLASQTIESPALPGAIQLTALPDDSGELRIVVLGRDGGGAVASVAFTRVPIPIKARTRLPLTLDTTFSDGDGDGVPDQLDGCPSVADADQQSARGYGHGPGDACADGGGDMAGGADMGPVVAACPAHALCDSFDGQLDPALWNVACNGTSAGCAQIDTRYHYRGAGSLHVHLDQTPAQKLDWATVTEIRTFPTEDLFARAFVWVNDDLSANATAIYTAVQKDAPFGALTLQLEDNGFSLYDGLQGKEQYVAPGGTLPKDKWFCLEWELKVGAQGAERVWLDGALLSAPSLTGDTTSTPLLGQFSLGLTVQAMANAVPARDIWFDEVIVSSKRVGCQ